MNLTEMKIEYDNAKIDFKNCQTKTARSGINDALYKLKKKIDAEENRIKTQLRKIVIDENTYEVPESFNWLHESSIKKYDVHKVDDVLYVIDNTNRLDKDGSYNWYHYVWIKQADNKYVKLIVHTLGKDMYGDRYFLEASYFKHPADPYDYMTKYINYNNRTYKPYVEHVLDKLGLIEALKDYRPRH